MNLAVRSTGALPGAGARAAAPARRLLGLSKSHISPSSRKASVEMFRGASYLSVKLGNDAPWQSKPPPRREIATFSNASRRRLLDLLAKVEVSQVPLFVTLTYPDEFPVYHEEYKRHLEVFAARLQRRWPEASVIWKLEFKPRKSGRNKGKMAPHYHLFVYGVPFVFECRSENGSTFQFRCERRDDVQDMSLEILRDGERILHRQSRAVASELSDPQVMKLAEDNPTRGSWDCLRDWVSRHWFDVVGSNTIEHFLAGTRVEKLRTVKGAFAYAAKSYMGKAEEMPELEHKPGRFWGVIGRKHLKLGTREERPLTDKQAVQLRRIIRRYRRANTPSEKRWMLWKGGLKSPEFRVKLYCNVEEWLRKLPELLGAFSCNFLKGAVSNESSR